MTYSLKIGACGYRDNIELRYQVQINLYIQFIGRVFSETLKISLGSFLK